MKNNSMKQLLKIFSIFSFILILSSCGGNEDRGIAESASAFINANDKVIVFGSIDPISIFEKAEYKNIPMVGALIDGQMKRVSSGLNLYAGFYYAMEGPFTDGNPATLYMFAEVKNLDSLKAVLTLDGYDFDSKDGIEYFRDGEATVGIKNKVAIMFVKAGEYDELAMAKKAFEMASGGVMEGSGARLLAQRGDISINSHMYNQFITANNQTASLPDDKKEQLADMMRGSFTQANIHFEKGQLRVAFDNQFSANLTKRMMMKEDPSASIRKKIGVGEPKIAVAMNLDMAKLQAWVDDFAPSGLDFLSKNSGPMQMIVLLAGGKIGNLVNGEMGVALFSDPSKVKDPEFAMYSGFGPNGKDLAEMVKNFPTKGDILMDVSSKGVNIYSNIRYKASNSYGFSVPKGAESFGKKGITGFANVDKMDFTEFELEGPEKLIELVKYVHLSMDTKGGELIIKTKNPNQNVLKLCVDKMLKEFEGQIGQLGDLAM